MKVDVKDLDGQRSMSIEITEDLPGSVFLYRDNGNCMEFDLGILLHALTRAQEHAVA